MAIRRFFLGYSNAYIMLVAVMGLLLSAGMPSAYGSTVIAFDAAASNSCGGGVPCGLTLTWSHTIGGGTNGILIVGVSEFNFPTPFAVTGVTFGGTALTPLTAQTNGFLLVQQWYLLNPSLSGTVTVTFATAPDAVVAGSVSFFNVSGLGASNGATGTGPPASVTIASANSGDLVVDTLVHLNPDTSPVAPQAQLWNLNDPTAIVMGGGSDKPASSSVTMQWTDFPSTDAWGLVAVDLQPAPTLITGVDAGSGSVDPNCPAPTGCSETPGATVTVTATPSSGWQFSSWSTQTGISCSSNPCVFTMPSTNVVLVATFIQVHAVHQTPVGGVMLPSVGVTVLLPWAVLLSLLGVLSVEAFRVKRRAKRR